MLTLEDLLDNVTVQGDVRVSAWENEEETVIGTFDAVEYLSANNVLLKKWRDAEVLYMFTPGDGFLHIEVERR